MSTKTPEQFNEEWSKRFKSDTPRTDAEVLKHNPIGEWNTGLIPPDFARTLERELAALRADKDRLEAIERVAFLRFEWNSKLAVYVITDSGIEDALDYRGSSLREGQRKEGEA